MPRGWRTAFLTERSDGRISKNNINNRVETMANVHQYWVYIMSNKTRSVLYIGVTNDLYRRYLEHKNGAVEGFTKKYKCYYLVYFEDYKSIEDAIAREKELKGWRREKKELLIATTNPEKKDLAERFGWSL